MRLIQKSRKKKSKLLKRSEVISREQYQGLDLNSRLALIQALVPLGLMAVQEELHREVEELAGLRYRHNQNPRGISRHGVSAHPGS